MSELYLEMGGHPVEVSHLSIEKAYQIATLLIEGSLPYVRFLVAKKAENGSEIIIFETDVELGQKRIYDIRPIERLAIVFTQEDDNFPEVFALRSDFPKVPHLNLKANEYPRSLCLYEEDYRDYKLKWSPVLFIERIRQWLALTAKGRLHNPDQPLEPFFTASTHIIIPYDLIESGSGAELLTFAVFKIDDNLRFLQCSPLNKEKSEIPFVGLFIEAPPQEHGVIYKQPKNLLELHHFLQLANIDLLDKIRSKLRSWIDDKPHENIYSSGLALFIVLPKTRREGGPVEISDLWVFLTGMNIAQIGNAIGIWDLNEGTPGLLLGTDLTKNGEEIELYITKPVFSFSKKLANAVSNIQNSDLKVALIGTGALGSQVFINLARMGYGQWTLIDMDYLLPHNLARHGLHSAFVGKNKAISLEKYANTLFYGEQIARGIAKNVLDSDNEDIVTIFKDSDVILDMSTSIAVARYLARDVISDAQRISMFLTPSGYDCVVLAEDKQRQTTLDYVEMQYYRHLINHVDKFKDHLKNPDNIRYSNSCRDVSSTIPQDVVSLHAAICSRALQKIVATEEGCIQIWKADPQTFEITHHKYPLERMIKYNFGEWTLCTDSWLIDKIYNLREEKLPNETGGVLIGSFDMQRKIVFVLDTIPSPPDSKEWPTLYIRGYQGLKKRVDEISDITAQQLGYVGEWHSHPRGVGCFPSSDDRKAFLWLSEYMALEGKPGIMLIAGDQLRYAWYVGKII
jgi:hypothetical protein